MPKILCLTSQYLDGPEQGAILRARNVFKLLSQFGEVRLVLAGFYVEWNGDPGPVCGGFELLRAIQFERTPKVSLSDRIQHDLNPRFMNTDWIQARHEDRDWLQETIAQYDLVWVHGLHVANGFGIWRWPHSVLDIDDIPSSYLRSKLPQTQGFKARLNLKRKAVLMERHERTLGERFDAVCVCSEPDHKLLDHLGKTFVVPNGFTLPRGTASRQPASPPRIGFVGNFTYAPNVEGARWFVDKIWPRIQEQHPRARLRLAGKNSDREPWPKDRNIDALGWLPDVEAEVASWSITVAPILSGGGTRLKIAEAFSHRCPLVSTSLGAYGYDVKDGEELLLADDPIIFADKCNSLLNDPSRGARMADLAWEKFKINWTWEAQGEKVAKAVNSVLSNSRTEFKNASQPA